jgi:hypothetical protein
MEREEKKFRYILDSARGCVHRGQAPQGIAHLDTIRREIDDVARTSVWVEYQLIFAGALAAMRDPGAKVAFEDALSRVSELSEPDPTITMLTHGDFGKFLAEQRAFKPAREHYALAERIAADLDRSEDSARFQMCIFRIDLEEPKDPKLVAFQKLKEAATHGYTHVEQREAWLHYVDTLQSYAGRLVATRKGGDASVDYFRGVLSEIRRRRSEVIK